MDTDVELGGIFCQNATYEYDNDYESPNDFEQSGSKVVWVPVLYLLVAIIGLLGNGLLLAVLVKRRRTWSFSDTFILSMSVSDILLLVILSVRSAQATQHFGSSGQDFFCKIGAAIFNVNFYCGILLLVCISLDRYLSIVHANQLYSLKRRRLAQISCQLVWLISVILTIPDWIFVVAEKDSAQQTQCVHKYNKSATDWRLVSRLPHHMLGFLLPATAMIILCICILLRLQCCSKGLKKQKSIVVLLLLVVVFLLCWIPYNITLIVDTFRSSAQKPEGGLSENPQGLLKTALMITFSMGCIHACLRPLLYFGLCANFRKQILAILRGASVKSESSLWELSVGEKALPKQGHEEEELKQTKNGLQLQVLSV